MRQPRSFVLLCGLSAAASMASAQTPLAHKFTQLAPGVY